MIDSSSRQEERQLCRRCRVCADTGCCAGWWFAHLSLAAAARDSKHRRRKRRARTRFRWPWPRCSKQDVPVYLAGLGSVTAFYTANIKSRVDGQIMRVNFKEGQIVKEGDLLIVIDPRPYQVQLEQMQAQLFKDQATLRDAKLNLDRYTTLIPSGSIAQQQVDTQKSLVDQLEGQVRTDQAQIDNAKLQIVYCHITAPFTGRVGLRQVDPGNIVHAADTNPMLILTQLQPIAVIFTLPEDELPTVAQHMKNATLAGGGLQPRRSDQAGDRQTADDRQPDRSDDGNGQAESRLRQQRQPALAEPVRERQPAAGDAEEQHGGADGRDSARAAGNVRLCGEAGQDGGSAHGDGIAYAGQTRRWSPAGSIPGDTVVTDGQDKLQTGSTIEPRSTRPEPAPCERHMLQLRTSRQLRSFRNSGFMSPSRLFILRPVATTLLMVGVLLVGWVAFMQLPVSALPEVDYPTIQVVTFYPGADPDVMASSVTSPLERQFGQVPGLSQMTSTSSFGSSVITLQFGLDQNIDVEEQQVQAAVNAASTYLPADLPNPPIYNKVNPADAPILTLAMTSDSLPLSKVEDLADTALAQKISQLPGVGLVSISGGQKPAVRVQVNPTALASYGLSLEDVRTALAAGQCGPGQGRDRRRAAVVHDWRQRSAFLQRAVQADRGRLSQRRAGAAERCGERDRRHGKQPAGGVDESDAGGDRQYSAAAGREHHQRGRPDQEAAAAVAGFAALGGEGADSHRPDHDDPRIGEGRGIRVGADHRAGGDRDFLFPAEPAGHVHSQRRGAAFDCGNVRRDVPAGIQPEQSDADGVDDLHRLRGG